MKLLVMGTGPFAVPTFEALLASDHEVCGLVTRPPAGSHRGKRKDINPMREAAEKAGLEIHDPSSVNDPEFESVLTDYAADLYVVCDYGQILSPDVLSTSRLGGINLHGSLLPRYRGAAPINWAIYHGDKVTGNSVILMTPRLDGGPVLETTELAIEASDTAITIEEKLSQLGPASVLSCIARLENWDGTSDIGVPQDKSLVSKAPRLKKSDGQVDWNRTAEQIFNQVRAFQPWPGTYSTLTRSSAPAKSAETRAILVSVEPVDTDETASSPGKVSFVSDEKLMVQTGKGQLNIIELQPSGKKPMRIADFLRGNAVSEGDLFS